MSSTQQTDPSDSALEGELDLAFAPLHKRCLGVAVGCAVALLVIVATLLHLVRAPDEASVGHVLPLHLLSQYFYGYTVSPLGALIGGLWGLWLGFVVGWSFAFTRNFVLAAIKVFFRARAELNENAGFLDHI